jgi:desulfoferrodoxin (superoxide reductase-like protein)
MATTVDQIAGYLKAHDLRYHIHEDRSVIVTGFATEHYVDKDGDKHIPVIIELEEDGEFIKIMVPYCYVYREGPHKQALFQALLMLCWQTKMLQFEYDATDGEVRAIVEYPLEDAPLTERQFMRTLMGLVALIDQHDDMVRRALDSGVIEKPADPEAIMDEFQQFLAQRRRRHADGDEPVS